MFIKEGNFAKYHKFACTFSESFVILYFFIFLLTLMPSSYKYMINISQKPHSTCYFIFIFIAHVA